MSNFIYCIVSSGEYYFEPYSFWLSEEEAKGEIKRLEEEEDSVIFQDLIVKKIALGKMWGA